MILHLLKKDISRKFREPFGFLILTSIPLVFSLLIGMIFGPGSGKEPSLKVKILIADRDSSFVSEMFCNVFGGSRMNDLFSMEKTDSLSGRLRMEKGEASALLVIPDGFGDAVLDRKRTSLVLIKNPSEAFAPKIAEQTVSILCEASERLVRIASSPIQVIRKGIREDSEFSEVEIALLAIQIRRLISKVEDILIPPQIAIRDEKAVSQHEEKQPSSVMYTHIISGFLTFFMLFVIEALARDLFQEQDMHTLSRLRTGPVSLAQFVASKQVFLFLMGLLSYSMVWLMAGVFFGLKVPLRIMPVFMAFSVLLLSSLTGIVGLIYSLARTRSQAQEISPALFILFGMLGGAMVSINNLPHFLQGLSVISPVYWGQDGIKILLLRPEDASSVLIHILIFSILTVVFNGAAYLLFYRKFRS
ncbi:ABC transporter permease [bacterium]|nr:ABC transporter permease [bacterium]